MLVRELPADPQGVLRVSIGGTPQIGGYCVFRGDREACAAVLRTALAALDRGPSEAVKVR